MIGPGFAAAAFAPFFVKVLIFLVVFVAAAFGLGFIAGQCL